MDRGEGETDEENEEYTYGDEYSVIYRIVEAVYCTPEPNILELKFTKNVSGGKEEQIGRAQMILK